VCSRQTGLVDLAALLAEYPQPPLCRCCGTPCPVLVEGYEIQNHWYPDGWWAFDCLACPDWSTCAYEEALTVVAIWVVDRWTTGRMPSAQYVAGMTVGREAFVAGRVPVDVRRDQVPLWAYETLSMFAHAERAPVLPPFSAICPVEWERHRHRGHQTDCPDVRGTHLWQQLCSDLAALGYSDVPQPLAVLPDPESPEASVTLTPRISYVTSGVLSLQAWTVGGQWDPVWQRPFALGSRAPTPTLLQLVEKWRASDDDPLRHAVLTAVRRFATEESWTRTVDALPWLRAAQLPSIEARLSAFQSLQTARLDPRTRAEVEVDDYLGTSPDPSTVVEPPRTRMEIDDWTTWRLPRPDDRFTEW